MLLDEESGDAVFVGFGTCGFQEVVEFGRGKQTVDVLGGVPGGAWVGFDAFLGCVSYPCGGSWLARVSGVWGGISLVLGWVFSGGGVGAGWWGGVLWVFAWLFSMGRLWVCFGSSFSLGSLFFSRFFGVYAYKAFPRELCAVWPRAGRFA